MQSLWEVLHFVFPNLHLNLGQHAKQFKVNKYALYRTNKREKFQSQKNLLRIENFDKSGMKTHRTIFIKASSASFINLPFIELKIIFPKNTGNVPNEECLYIIDDMRMTEGDLLEALGLSSRNGQTNPTKLWTNGVIPITFDRSQIEAGSAEEDMLWAAASQFNKDMNGCLSMV